jgi:hypothetical protein
LPIEICNVLASTCVPDWDGVAAIATAAATAAALLIPPWQRSRDRKERERALAYSLLLKMMKIHSDESHLWEHVQEQRAIAIQHGEVADTWRFFQPLASVPTAVKFTSDELACLFAAKDGDVFNAVLSMDEVHAGDMANLQIYGQKRSKLTDMLPGAAMNGQVGSTVFTPEQYSRFIPYSTELDILISDIATGIENHVVDTEKALRGLHAVITSVFKMKVTLVLPPAAPTPDSARSAATTPPCPAHDPAPSAPSAGA